MKLHELSPAPGSNKKGFRVGRGAGSGNGKTAGKGHKGQNARAGGGVRPGFEGGQLPLYRRLPKRGFKNRFANDYAEVNVGKLSCFDANAVVDMESLRGAGILRRRCDGVRVLGMGELDRALTVRAAGFSASAKEKIEAAGGKAEVV